MTRFDNDDNVNGSWHLQNFSRTLRIFRTTEKKVHLYNFEITSVSSSKPEWLPTETSQRVSSQRVGLDLYLDYNPEILKYVWEFFFSLYWINIIQHFYFDELGGRSRSSTNWSFRKKEFKAGYCAVGDYTALCFVSKIRCTGRLLIFPYLRIIPVFNIKHEDSDLRWLFDPPPSTAKTTIW